MKIVEYKVVRASSSLELSLLVQDNIHTGWQPYGSMAVVQATNVYTHYYNQAMVKYEP